MHAGAASAAGGCTFVGTLGSDAEFEPRQDPARLEEGTSHGTGRCEDASRIPSGGPPGVCERELLRHLRGKSGSRRRGSTLQPGRSRRWSRPHVGRSAVATRRGTHGARPHVVARPHNVGCAVRAVACSPLDAPHAPCPYSAGATAWRGRRWGAKDASCERCRHCNAKSGATRITTRTTTNRARRAASGIARHVARVLWVPRRSRSARFCSCSVSPLQAPTRPSRIRNTRSRCATELTATRIRTS